MESKQEFIEHIQKLGKGHFHYLNALFERCPDYVIKHMRYMEIPKGYHFEGEGQRTGFADAWKCIHVYGIFGNRGAGRL